MLRLIQHCAAYSKEDFWSAVGLQTELICEAIDDELAELAIHGAVAEVREALRGVGHDGPGSSSGVRRDFRPPLNRDRVETVEGHRSTAVSLRNGLF